MPQLFFSLAYTLAVSLYDSANQFRLALLAQETQARARLVSAYLPILDNLSYQLAQLLAQIEAAQRDGRTLSKWELQREQRFRMLIAQAAQQIQLYASRVPGLLTLEQQRAVDAALIHAPQLLAEASGDIAQAFNRLPREAVAQFVGFAGDGSPLNKLFQRYGHEKAELLKQTMLDGLAQGRGLRAVGRQAAALLERPRWEAERIARTEILRSYREAARATYQESEIVTGWQWLAAKSTRTCAACLAMDRQEFPLSKPMPSHPNCRCTVIPVVTGVKPPQRQSGETWLRAQSKADQVKVLGEAGARAFRDGLPLSNWVGVAKSKEWGEARFRRSLADALKGPQKGALPVSPKPEKSAPKQPGQLVPALPRDIKALLQDQTRNVYFEAGQAAPHKISPAALGLSHAEPPRLRGRVKQTKTEVPIERIIIGRDNLDRDRILRLEEQLQGGLKRTWDAVFVSPHPTLPGYYIVNGDGNHRVAYLRLSGYNGAVPVVLKESTPRAL